MLFLGSPHLILGPKPPVALLRPISGALEPNRGQLCDLMDDRAVTYGNRPSVTVDDCLLQGIDRSR